MESMQSPELDYDVVIDLIQKIKNLTFKEDEDENLFSICGFPHYERVISNVLAFFLDNQREHGFGNLFIESLLSLSDINAEDIDLNYKVETETRTEKGNFIDVYIIGEGYRIIIENKINASLYNDLNDYYNFASKENTLSEDEENSVIAFVLSLYPQNKTNKNFIFISYNSLFTEIKRRLGEHIIDSNQKYHTLLFDLIRNIEKLKTGESMDYEFVDIVKENMDEIYLVNKKSKVLHDDLRRTVNMVNSQVVKNFEPDKIHQWAWRDLPEFFDISVTDIYLIDVTISIDSVIDLSGWHFEVFLRNPKEEFDLESFLKDRNIKFVKKDRFIVDHKFKLDEKPTVVAEYITGLVNAMLKE